MSIQLVGTENLPNLYINEVEVYENSKRYFVSPLIYLYDFKRNNSFQWYENQSLRENMKVIVVVSSSESFNTGVTAGRVALTPKHIRNAAGYSKTLVKYKVLSLHGASKESFDEAVGGLYTFPYRCKFNIKKNKNVSVFAATFLDIRQFSSENALDLSSERSNSYHGAIVGEIVFENGKVPTSSTMLLTRQGAPYAGPVHRHNRRYMAGSRHSTTTNQARLTTTRVRNTKVKHFNLPFRRKRRRGRWKKTPVVGNLFPSVDRNGHLRAMFAIDTEQILLHKCEYGYMLRGLDEELFDALRTSLKITNLAIIKQQVKQVRSQTGRVGTVKVKAVGITTPKTLVETKDRRGRRSLQRQRKFSDDLAHRTQIESSDSDTATANSLVLKSAITEISDWESHSQGVRLISFQDNAGNLNSAARFAYSVEFEMKDPTEDYMQKVYRKMQTSMSSFKNYKRRVLRKTNYNPHTYSTKPNLYKNTDNGAWEPFLKNFLDIYSMFFVLQEDRQTLYNKLALMVHPKTATSNSIEWFEDRYNYVFSYFKKYFKVNASTLAPKVKLGRVKVDDGKGKVKITKRFKEIVDYGKHRATVSFVPTAIAGTSGRLVDFPVLTHNDIRSMAHNERFKYFKDAPSFNNDTVPTLPDQLLSSLNNIRYNSYTYFSPATLTLNKNDTMDLSKIENIDLLKFNEFYINSLKGKRDHFLYQPEKRRTQAISSGEKSSFYIRRKRREREREEEYESSHKVIGRDSDFPQASKEETKIGVSEDNRDIRNRFTSFEQLREAPQSPRMADYHLFNQENILMSIANSKKSNTTKMRFIRAIPLQIKALMGSPYGFARNNMFFSSKDLLRDSYSKNLTKAMFLSVVKVQYLKGYASGNVCNPQWVDLNEYNFSRTVNKGAKTILCRLVPFDSSTLKLDSELLNKVGIENEYFYISRRRFVPRPNRTKPTAVLISNFDSVSSNAFSGVSDMDLPVSRTIIVDQPIAKVGTLRFVDFAADNITRTQQGSVPSESPTRTGGGY